MSQMQLFLRQQINAQLAHEISLKCLSGNFQLKRKVKTNNLLILNFRFAVPLQRLRLRHKVSAQFETSLAQVRPYIDS